MRLDRRQRLALAPLLVGFVLAVDAFWALGEGSTGALGYGLVDEPAHLATCAVLLLALATVAGPVPLRLLLAALVASVAIDIDHLPGYLGSQVFLAGMPRPFSHSVPFILAPLIMALAASRPDVRQVSLGFALGILAHLLRDLATGPGIPLLWPLTDAAISTPYPVYAGLLVALAVALMAPLPFAVSRRQRGAIGAPPMQSACPPSGS